ncbi:NAD(+)/NADH kinase [Pectinatus frisingensis]|jgi:NAD+ kinase|uniref:NAD(+)/NADH kinase n=1 Tax=Pectinatus frisingensis TaxID=865 RepID=UPI0015F74A2B|nr:NAD(+)/NADH kinase [Pectinatus frisingensis]
MRIGIFPNCKKKDSKKILDKVIAFLTERHSDIFIPLNMAKLFGYEIFATDNILKTNIDVGLSIGGDGTLLGVCRLLAPHNIPVCGINIGNLGFLADIEVSELTNKLQKILTGNYKIEQRLMLAGYLKKDNALKLAGYAVNDIVLTSTGVARMIGLELELDSYKVADYRADGLIVSTATGSTAYSLSAGGPIINPKVKVLLVTPICPHTFYVRPMIINETEQINITVKNTSQQVSLTFDGQDICPIGPDEQVMICKAPFMAKIIKFDDKNYYKILLNKLIRSDTNADNQ